MKKYLLSAVMATASVSMFAQAPQLRADNIDAIIAAMTPEEKIDICIGTGMAGLSSNDGPVIGETRSIVPGAAGTTYPIPRLGIPAIVLADGPAGLRIDPTRDFDSKTYYCTHFPIGTSLACSWNTELVTNVGKAMGNEVLEYGADVYLAPAINIHRNPLCGRNFEYYSEDPIVAGAIATAYINGVQSNGVGTSIKHFAGNNQETNRFATNARMTQRALREIYLRGFEKAIKNAAPWTVMSSYNFINGIYTSQNKALQTTILRDEWGFKGLVMTDWLGGNDAVAQLNAGNDMLQPGTPKQREQLLEGLKRGTLTEDMLNLNVRRVLELIVKSPRFKGYKYSNSPDLKTHAAVTRQSATEGMVLLSNDGTLPLNTNVNNVAVYGCTSYNMIAGGTGSGNVNRAYTVSLIEGLRNAGYTVDGRLLANYKKHLDAEKKKAQSLKKDMISAFLPQPLPAEYLPSETELEAQVAANDVAIITLGRLSGEFVDRKVSDFNLSSEEKNLIENVSKKYKAAGKKVVVVLNIGGVIETASWKNQPNAVLVAWQGGQEGGNSIADVLKGRVSPSGKLTMTFPINFDDAASSANFPKDGDLGDMMSMINHGLKTTNLVKDVDYTNYEEDIYVGYRYFDTFQKEVSYPFGYGMSYTTFEYSNATVSYADNAFQVSVSIKNNGKANGKEVVQVYVSAPKSGLNKPVKELKAFGKTKELKPGESQTLTMTITAEDLASFNEKQVSWIADAGQYGFHVGASSRDIRANLTCKLPKTFKNKVNNVMNPQVKLNILKSK